MPASPDSSSIMIMACASKTKTKNVLVGRRSVSEQCFRAVVKVLSRRFTFTFLHHASAIMCDHDFSQLCDVTHTNCLSLTGYDLTIIYNPLPTLAWQSQPLTHALPANHNPLPTHRNTAAAKLCTEYRYNDYRYYRDYVVTFLIAAANTSIIVGYGV